jgi:hypothetical protein
MSTNESKPVGVMPAKLRLRAWPQVFILSQNRSTKHLVGGGMSDGHPIIENYVLVRHATRHLKRDVTPHAPET